MNLKPAGAVLFSPREKSHLSEQNNGYKSSDHLFCSHKSIPIGFVDRWQCLCEGQGGEGHWGSSRLPYQVCIQVFPSCLRSHVGSSRIYRIYRLLPHCSQRLHSLKDQMKGTVGWQLSWSWLTHLHTPVTNPFTTYLTSVSRLHVQLVSHSGRDHSEKLINVTEDTLSRVSVKTQIQRKDGWKLPVFL